MSETGSVDRAFAILELFERERRPLSFKEIGEACRIPASTCHNLVHTLLDRAYLYQLGRRRDFYPTRRLLDLSTTIVAHDPLMQRIGPAMEELRDATRETVILGKRQKDVVVYLAVLESPEVIRYSARAGDTRPLHSSSIGKCMLSGMKPDELAKWLDEHPTPKVTAHTITNPDTLSSELEAGRRRGYFMTRGENVPDVSALAVPVNLNNELSALAIAGPSHRIDARREQIAKSLVRAQAVLLDAGLAGRA